MKDYCETIYINISNKDLVNMLKDAANEGFLDPFYENLFLNEELVDHIQITVKHDD